MVILTQYHTEIQNRGISTIGASEIFPVSRMPRFQMLHCTMIGENRQRISNQIFYRDKSKNESIALAICECTHNS